MKPFLSCVLLLLVGGVASSSLYAQGPPLGKEEARKNKIKEIRKYSNSICDPAAKISDSSSKVRTWSSEVWTYDARGNETRWSQASTWIPVPAWFVEYKYDDRDNIVERTEDYVKTRFEHNYTLNDKGKIVEDTYPGGKHTIKYNAAGDEVESDYLHDGRLVEKTTHTFDDKGEMEETVAYDSGGQPTSRTVNVYDPERHNTRHERYSSGRLSLKIVSTYDTAGHKSAEEKYEADGHLSSRTIHTYDQAGHSAKEEHYGPDGKTLVDWRTFKFDPKGLVIESDDFNSKGECNWFTTITYEFYQ
jgi:hypothetical protein